VSFALVTDIAGKSPDGFAKMSAGAAPAAVDVVIIDANVIINIAEGNAPAAEALLRD